MEEWAERERGSKEEEERGRAAESSGLRGTGVRPALIRICQEDPEFKPGQNYVAGHSQKQQQ